MKTPNNFKNDILNQIKELIKYYDLGFVFNNLEGLINLPIPYKNPHFSNSQYTDNMNLTKETNKRSNEIYEELLSEVNLRKTTFRYIRSINPHFCENMKDKLPAETYEEYLYYLKKSSKDMADLIKSFHDRDNDYNDLLMKKKDDISNIIDSAEISELTYLQDMFVLEELNAIDDIDTMYTMDTMMQENVSKIKQQLHERISRYREFQKIYSSKNIIKLKNEERD